VKKAGPEQDRSHICLARKASVSFRPMQEIKQTSKQTEPAESIAQHLTLSKNGAFLFWCGNQSLSVHGAAAAIGSTLTMTRYTRTIQNNMDVPFRSIPFRCAIIAAQVLHCSSHHRAEKRITPLEYKRERERELCSRLFPIAPGGRSIAPASTVYTSHHIILSRHNSFHRSSCARTRTREQVGAGREVLLLLHHG